MTAASASLSQYAVNIQLSAEQPNVRSLVVIWRRRQPRWKSDASDPSWEHSGLSRMPPGPADSGLFLATSPWCRRGLPLSVSRGWSAALRAHPLDL